MNTNDQKRNDSRQDLARKVEKKDSELKAMKKERRYKIGTIICCIVLIIYFIGAAVGLGFYYSMTKDLDPVSAEDFESSESTKIYDANGTLIAELGTFLRDNITYDDLPEAVIDAFLSAEDSRFFVHNGFDVPRFTSALISYLQTHEFGSGASTFTMQLVKNTYFTVEDENGGTERTKSIEYKVQQITLAIQAEKLLSKKEIIELYLNKLNFGKNIRGVQTASQYYFGKDVDEVTTSEAALLAGIVNLPNTYNPYSYLDYATERRDEILDLMAYHGYITDEECALAKTIKVEDQLVGEYKTLTVGYDYQSYIDTVIAEAQKLTGFDPTDGGMTIYTAMEPAVQNAIESLENGETISLPDDEMQMAIVSLNNTNGEIVGIGGGRNQTGSMTLNRATDMYVQPGSSVKPFLSYALAFEYLGYSMDETLKDQPITLEGETTSIKNADGTTRGTVSLKDAVAWSLNLPAVDTIMKVEDAIGSTAIEDYLQSLGFSQIESGTYQERWAIGGNGFTCSPVELAAAHAAMINLGQYNEPHTIRTLEYKGQTYDNTNNESKTVISSGSAYLADLLMQNNVEGGYYNYLGDIKRDNYSVYGKTGTTDWGDSGLQYGIPYGSQKDKWMTGSTTNYTNTVWLGWDQATSAGTEYYTSWMDSMNYPGQVINQLLDAEETIDGANLSTITQPEDVQDVTFVTGTYPHVAAESWMSSSMLTTSKISSAGLLNVPLVSASDSDGTAPTLSDLSVSLDGDTVNVSWSVSAGSSLAQNIYHLDVYADGTAVNSSESTDSSAGISTGGSAGEIQVCGYVYNIYGSSDTICKTAGTASTEETDDLTEADEETDSTNESETDESVGEETEG